MNSFLDKSSKVSHFNYDKVGHKSYAYFFSKSESSNVKMVWVLKLTIVTNQKGSKKAWVPKVKT